MVSSKFKDIKTINLRIVPTDFKLSTINLQL